MVFCAILSIYLFEVDSDTDDSVSTGRGKKLLYASLWHIDEVRFRMKVEWEKLCSKADLSKQKWNGLVSSSQHSWFGTWPFEEGGGAAGYLYISCHF